jgi:hypothetical protein
MVRRPVAVAVVVALLFCGAAVSLEAVGLLFHTGVPDPQQRIEAFVSRLEADLSPVDLPTEPVEVPVEMAAQLPGNDSRPVPVAQPIQDGDDASKVAEIQDRTEPEGTGGDPLAVAISSTAPIIRPESATHADEAAAPGPPASHVPPASHGAAPDPAPLPAAQASSEAPAAARPAQGMAGARRSKPTQSPTGYAAFGWPVLDWLIW